MFVSKKEFQELKDQVGELQVQVGNQEFAKETIKSRLNRLTEEVFENPKTSNPFQIVWDYSPFERKPTLRETVEAILDHLKMKPKVKEETVKLQKPKKKGKK